MAVTWGLLALISLFQRDLSRISSFPLILLHLFTSLSYTMHTLSLYFINDQPLVSIERSNRWMMGLHLLSGPLSLVADMMELYYHGCVGTGGVLILLKILTIPMIKGILLGIINIIPLLMIPFLAICSFIMVLAQRTVVQLGTVENFWVNFSTSVYTFF